jgi:uncharacterized protein
MNKTMVKLSRLASDNPEIIVLWLYGSRANHTHHPDSDYDLAIAFKTFLPDPLEIRLRPEMLALAWQSALQFHENQLSIIDINQVSISLASEVIRCDNVLFCRDTTRLWQEEKRISSRMEVDVLYHIRNYGKN